MGKISTMKCVSSLSGIRVEQSADGRVLVTFTQDTNIYKAVAALPELQDSLTYYGIYGHDGGGMIKLDKCEHFILCQFDPRLNNHRGGCQFFARDMREFWELKLWLCQLTAHWLRERRMRP